MILNDSVLTPSEKTSFRLRELFLSKGYRPYRMSKFEEYDLYAGNKDFLVSDNVITFTDTDGKLLALKPDVTLSIIKNTTDPQEGVQRVFYDENVYRVSRGSGTFREIMQTGIECFGKVTPAEIASVLALALESLALLPGSGVLAVSDLDLILLLLDRLALRSEERAAVFEALAQKNQPQLEKQFSLSGPDAIRPDPDAAWLLSALLSLHGPASETLPKLVSLLQKAGLDPASACGLTEVLSLLKDSPYYERILIDFSVVGDIHYYNGIIFKGFLRTLPEEVLSGGQYDTLMQRCKRSSRAIGFAVYTDALNAIRSDDIPATAGDDTLNIALPKGRLGEIVYSMFASAGYECPSILEPNRKLIFENQEKKVRYFWVKPSDVPIYVERGAADIGVAGKDILLEYSPAVYELLDLKKGKCRMAVAAPKGYQDHPDRPLRVATKFSAIATEYYRAMGRDIDIIHLNGSIEIAPILGLSDVIVDIVETGTTLRENDLEVIAEVVPISARVIANKASFKFKSTAVEQLVRALALITEEIR